MKKILLGIILVAMVLVASNQGFIKQAFAQWDNSWNNTNGDCPGCVYWCPDGVHQYYYSQSECPSAQQPQQQQQYNWCPDGVHQYYYSQSECPSSQQVQYNWCADGVHQYLYSQSECPSTQQQQYNWCADGVHQYLYSQTECPSTPQPQPQQQYNWCADGVHQYLYSQTECPATVSPMIYQPYTPTTYIQPSYNYPTYNYSQPSFNYPTYNYPTQTQQQSFQCWNGTWVYNISQCPTQTQTCPNGTVIPVTQSCPAQTQTCWNGTVIPVSQSCPAQFQTCADGTVILASQVCPVNTHTCWNGSVLPLNQACPIQYQTCPNGSVIPITQTCPSQYQTCWNGTVIPVSQTCPSQYQTCWNGTVIPVSQTCPVKTITTVIVKSVEIRTHSVITNLATQVGSVSAVCNGTGFISGNMSSVGWFEYGTTVNLGNTTNSANIGSDQTSSFSNLITGLKPNTTYYCRAVMANADGTYKGKIISFMTSKNKKVIYAAPTKKSTTKVKTKTEFVCSDGSLAVARTVAIADTINSGGKLISINIERNNPDLVQGSLLNYRITITNNADTAITGVEEKIVLPSEMSFVDATTTGGVTIKDNIMTVPIGNMNAKEAKTFILPVKIAKDASIGKAVMTTVYVSYNLPVTGSTIVKDEVSSYMVANIVGIDGTKDTSSTGKSSSSLASILFPQTLLGWLVLFAIILVIVVLVMNIHKWIKDRKKEKEEHSIHHHIA